MSFSNLLSQFVFAAYTLAQNYSCCYCSDDNPDKLLELHATPGQGHFLGVMDDYSFSLLWCMEDLNQDQCNKMIEHRLKY